MSEKLYIKQDNFIIHKNYSKLKLKKIKMLLSIFLESMLHLILQMKKVKNRKYKTNVSICAIFKDEAMFLAEWIEYHLLIGVEHFYLYDNNSCDNPERVLKSYIEKGLVTYTKWPLTVDQQLKAYEHFFGNFKHETQWIGFLDIDEFLNKKNISDWLKGFIKYPCVAIYWLQFGSNQRKEHDKKLLTIEQYTSCWPSLSNLSKCFCNNNYDFKKLYSPHVFSIKLNGLFQIPAINQFKKFILFGLHRGANEEFEICINHYWNKADDLFKAKLEKTDAIYPDHEERRLERLKLYKSHESWCIATNRDLQQIGRELRKKLNPTN